MPKLSRRDAGLLILVTVGFFAPHSLAADGKQLAIKGYDPVAYFKSGSPRAGCRNSSTNGMSTATSS